MMTSSQNLLFIQAGLKHSKMLIEDELSLSYNFSNAISPLFLEKVLRNLEDAGTWCDIKHSNKIETCAELSKKSLTISLRRLKNEYGSDVNKWRWGNEENQSSPFSEDGILVPKFLRNINEVLGCIYLKLH